jgi:hypothetical protein
MSFTAATTTELSKLDKQVELVLELRTNFAESNSWVEVDYVAGSLRINYQDNRPATLSAELVWNAALAQERSKTNECQIFAQARVTANVRCTDAVPVVIESEVKFQGRIEALTPTDTSCVLQAASWDLLLDETECEVNTVPKQVLIRADWDGADPADMTDFRQVVALATGEHVFAFAHDGTTTDPAFTQAGQAASPQVLIRRPWAPTAVRLYSYDPGATPAQTFSDKAPVPSTHWSIDWHAGAMTIAEEIGTKLYYVTNVKCYLESAATGATDVDVATVLKTGLQYVKASGGIGAVSGELDFPASLGLDLASALYFRGRTGDLLRDLQKQLAPHMRLWWEASTGKWTLALTEQTATEDLTLLHARSVALNRATRDLYSRIVVTGKVDYPANALTTPGGGWTLGSDLGASAVFTWNENGELAGTGTWQQAFSRMLDDDGNTGAFVSNLDGGFAYRYSHWYEMFQFDFGEIRSIEYVSVVMAHTRNKKAANGHQGAFWPGCRIETSEDGTNWQLLTPLIDGRYKPLSQIEATAEKLLAPRCRYVRVLAGAYKYSGENGADPALGFNEIRISTSVTFREVLEIDGNASPASYYYYSRDVDGDGVLDPWQRNHADLWTRLGQRHRSKFIELGSQYTQSAARDLGLSYLDESVRLFEGLSFSTVCDPRVRLYQTAKVVDSWNGFTGSILVERLTLTDRGSTIEGTNYLAEGLDNA